MEILSIKFNNLITEYQNTYKELVNVINSENNNLTTMSNSAFVGDDNINTIQNSSVNNCMKSCNSTTGCSGATFDEQSNSCILSSGNGSVINSTNSTAIIQQALYYSVQLQSLNQQLLEINNQMSTLANTNMNNYNKNTQNINEKSDILNKNYYILEEERDQISNMVSQYNRLNSTLQNGSINVTSNYYRYIVFLLIVIFLIFILIRFSGSSEQYGGGEHLKFNIKLVIMYIVLGVIIIFNSYMKK